MKREAEQILKVDRAGRVWTPPERREAILDEFARSGMPASQFGGPHWDKADDFWFMGAETQKTTCWSGRRNEADEYATGVTVGGGDDGTFGQSHPTASGDAPPRRDTLGDQ